MKPVIHSLLDTDLYKFSMWQAMLHRHPTTQARYTFVCRNRSAYPLAALLDELAWLGGLRYIKSDFVDFLRIFQFQREFIRASVAHGQLTI